ncbi:MAG: T9SS type A sorting domain-containing protein [Bacteroidota bacterium]|nr:T9SS type A sorting domain-containing protein [Bacteroidota bacterium]
MLGNEVKTLVNEYKLAGSYTVSFDASKLSSGVYIYRIVTGNYTAARKMTLIK